MEEAERASPDRSMSRREIAGMKKTSLKVDTTGSTQTQHPDMVQLKQCRTINHAAGAGKRLHCCGRTGVSVPWLPGFAASTVLNSLRKQCAGEMAEWLKAH